MGLVFGSQTFKHLLWLSEAFLGKITNTQRLTVEQFPEQKDWIGRMFSVVNDYFQKVQSTINGSIEYDSNILGKEITFDFIYGSATANLPLTYKWTLNKPPRALKVVYSAVGVWSGTFDTSANTDANDSAHTMAVVTNKSLLPAIISVCWEYTAEGNVSITDLVILKSGYNHVRSPIAGQRVVLRVRVEP